ncbi:MAG: hypothetical protein K2L45_08140 [Muribaculaceae bacterium]|nr:hypothetical protein [Muribaculaceae bacterium]
MAKRIVTKIGDVFCVEVPLRPHLLCALCVIQPSERHHKQKSRAAR